MGLQGVTGGEDLDVCPAAQWGSPRPIDYRMTLSQRNGAAVSLAPGSWEETDLPNDSFCGTIRVCVCVCAHAYVRAAFTQNLAPLLSEGTIFFREELCLFLNTIL